VTVTGKFTECAEGHEVMDEDDTSDTEMTAGSSDFYSGHGRRLYATAEQKIAAVKVSEDTLSLRARG
jgi:hypothetical protein